MNTPITYSLIPDYKPCHVFPLIRPVAPAGIQFVPDDDVEAVEDINVGDIGDINDIIREIPYNNAAGQNNYIQINNNNQPITVGPGKTEYLRGYNEVGLPPGDVIKRRRRRDAFFPYIVYTNVQTCCNDLFERLEDLTEVQAERRARKLLRKHLTKDEYEEYRTKGYFFVTSNKGNHFKLESGKLPLQYYNRTDKDYYLSHCIYLGEHHNHFPAADQLLAWKLILQNDEDQLLKIANSTPGPTHPNWLGSKEQIIDDLIVYLDALGDEIPPAPVNRDIIIDEYEKYVLDWTRDLGVPPTDNDYIIARHLQDCDGHTEIPPWCWEEEWLPEWHPKIPEELIGLYSEWPRLVL